MRTRNKELPAALQSNGSTIVMDYGNFDQYLRDMGAPYVAVLGTMNPGNPVATSLIGTSVITDEPHGRQSVNFCRHVSEKYDSPPYDMISNYGSTWMWRRGVRAVPVSMAGFTHPQLSLPSYGMTHEAWQGMQPDISSGLSLTNSIIELKDFRRLARLLVGGAKALTSFASKVANQGITKTMAQLNLANNLALQPTLQDLSNISLKLPNFRESLRRFDAKGAKPSKRGYRKVYPTLTTVYTDGEFWYRKEVRSTYTVGGLCTYQRRTLGAYDDFLQYAGLTLTPKQAWDALPFSFLVDYVLNVGDTLERLSGSENISASWTQLCASTKTEVSVTKLLPNSGDVKYFAGGLGGPSPEGLPVAVTTSTIYERFPTNPPVWAGLESSLPKWLLPTDKQLGNAISLLRTTFKR